MEQEIGPVEYLAVVFNGNRFRGEIVPALADLLEQGLIRIIDLVVIIKDEAGNVEILEANELSDEVADALDALGAAYVGLLSEEDLMLLAADLPAQCTAAAMLFENVWAARFAQAVRAAEGDVVMNVRIPHAVVQAARQSLLDMEQRLS